MQNSKVYAKSPEFSPALGLIIFWEEICRYKFEVNEIPSSLNYNFFLYIYIYILYIYGQTRLHYPARLRARVIIVKYTLTTVSRYDFCDIQAGGRAICNYKYYIKIMFKFNRNPTICLYIYLYKWKFKNLITNNSFPSN